MQSKCNNYIALNCTLSFLYHKAIETRIRFLKTNKGEKTYGKN